MSTKNIYALILIGLISFTSCQNTAEKSEQITEDKTNTTNMKEVNNLKTTLKNEMDSSWYGIYKGTIPCADCEGINTKITLEKDGTFNRTTEYLGKSEQKYVDKGTYTKNNDSAVITLTFEDNTTQQYELSNAGLLHLDKNGNKITGDLADKYKLIKNKSNTNLEDKTWVLIELLGKPIQAQENQKEISLIFVSTNGLLAGNDGCNRFKGEYELLEGNRFKSGPFSSTLMACENMDTAKRFMKVIEKSDTYILTDTTLSFSKARMAVMAKFKLKEN